MAKHEIPSFASPETHEATICGQKLTFYAVSGPVLLRLQQKLGGPFARGMLALRAGQDAQEAIAELLEAVGKSPHVVGELVLDALHDEPWVERPVQPKAIEAFLGRVDGPSLARMLAAVATVNAMAFLPSVPELLQAFVAAVSGSIPTTEPVSVET